jgi:hypothetical protein
MQIVGWGSYLFRINIHSLASKVFSYKASFQCEDETTFNIIKIKTQNESDSPL